ncbi:hypothetical protein DYB30_001013 [Aphanomyces astaci]|uniref:Dehydrogenase E1 component domain-containing protein n=3 Tax=Aphanomyces astaci TaxID=112090 RepID=A0A397DPH8_APHAT|nr:hypothetical protein DYB30_001013 [Aphanomyces astaci]RHY76135.1 hypothetical protein DYB34_008921 [Aphanomyces astaci]
MWRVALRLKPRAQHSAFACRHLSTWVTNEPGATPAAEATAVNNAKTIHRISPNHLRSQEDTRRVQLLIRTFKQYGHFVAHIDPLKKSEKSPELQKWNWGSRCGPTVSCVALSQCIDPTSVGFSEEDLDREFFIGDDLSIGPVATLRDDHEFTPAEKVAIFNHMLQAELFEKFLGRRFSGAKRFSVEGGESLIPGLKELLQTASDLGVEAVYMGMAHRGRLNVLANVLERPLRAIMSQFQPYLPDEPDYPNNSDDVRYHLGTVSHLTMRNGNVMQVRSTSDIVSQPIAFGSGRAFQDIAKDTDRSRVMPLLLHGDASMFQGSVREAFGFSGLEDFKTGGTVHVIINNQIGFTTLPKQADSAVDVAKISRSPIFHVNGDDPEAVVKVMKMAVEFRQKYKCDVVVDLVCYRRHGHNEQDSPEITAPVMYHCINQHPTVITLYFKQLQSQGILTAEQCADLISDIERNLASEHDHSKTAPSFWDNLGDTPPPLPPTDVALSNVDKDTTTSTGVNRKLLQEIGAQIFRIPAGFTAHKKVEAIMNNRLRAVETGARVDWATAEALAFGSLLAQGVNVRLSGQDCERGTFNQVETIEF